jgi:hypothetical protein
MYSDLANSSDGVYFQPWVGTNYANSRWDLRVLIVGESHYEYEPERWRDGRLMARDTTQHILGNLIGPEQERRPHWTKIATSFLGEKPPRLPPSGPMFSFWHSVAYFNFVQEGVGLDNQSKATDEMFAASSSAFVQVLAKTRPDFVVVMSRRAWRYLPPDSIQLGTIPNLYRVGSVAQTASRNSILFMGLPHPRAAAQFGNARHWQPVIMKGIRLAQEIKQDASV